MIPKRDVMNTNLFGDAHCISDNTPDASPKPPENVMMTAENIEKTVMDLS